VQREKSARPRDATDKFLEGCRKFAESEGPVDMREVWDLRAQSCSDKIDDGLVERGFNKGRISVLHTLLTHAAACDLSDEDLVKCREELRQALDTLRLPIEAPAIHRTESKAQAVGPAAAALSSGALPASGGAFATASAELKALTAGSESLNSEKAKKLARTFMSDEVVDELVARGCRTAEIESLIKALASPVPTRESINAAFDAVCGSLRAPGDGGVAAPHAPASESERSGARVTAVDHPGHYLLANGMTVFVEKVEGKSLHIWSPGIIRGKSGAAEIICGDPPAIVGNEIGRFIRYVISNDDACLFGARPARFSVQYPFKTESEVPAARDQLHFITH
jgi:hypothetical protein